MRLGDINQSKEPCLLCAAWISAGEGELALIEQRIEDKGIRRYSYQHRRDCLDISQPDEPEPMPSGSGVLVGAIPLVKVTLDMGLCCECGNVMLILGDRDLMCQVKRCDHYGIHYKPPIFELKRRG